MSYFGCLFRMICTNLYFFHFSLSGTTSKSLSWPKQSFTILTMLLRWECLFTVGWLQSQNGIKRWYTNLPFNTVFQASQLVGENNVEYHHRVSKLSPFLQPCYVLIWKALSPKPHTKEKKHHKLMIFSIKTCLLHFSSWSSLGVGVDSLVYLGVLEFSIH